MLVTFSINTVMTLEKLKKVDKLVSEINDYNREYTDVTKELKQNEFKKLN